MSRSATWTDWSCTVTVTVEHDRRLDEAARVVRDLMAQVDVAASRFRDDSDLAFVNRSAGRMVPVSRLAFDLVAVARRAADDTAGLVDPCLGAHLAQLGYDDDIDLVRSRAARTRPTTGAPLHGSIRTDDRFRLVGVPRGFHLDLGATAKAWTADEAARLISRRLDTAVLVEIGGDLSVAGGPTLPWRIDVAEQRGGSAERVDLAHGGLATSSTRERRWTTDDGRSVHHMIDPRTGRPTAGPWRTVSAWAPTAVRANTASTAALVLGDAALPWLAQRGVAARLVREDGTVTRVGAWPQDRAVAA